MSAQTQLWEIGDALGLAPPAAHSGMTISDRAVSVAKRPRHTVETAWTLPTPPPGVTSRLVTAMDWAPQDGGALYSWARDGLYAEGLGFYGFAYLAELLQRSEYRQIVQKYAEHATRKWIQLRGGKDTRRDELWKALEKYKVRELFRKLVEHDGGFGRGQLYVDTGTSSRIAQGLPLMRSPYTLKGKLRGFKTVEPVWSYPGRYNSSDPLADDWYRPGEWYVSGRTVHDSRMLTVVGAPVPDMLKPAYAFAGLSRTQMAKPYVDNWLRGRQSGSDLLHAFSVMVLATDMATVLQGGPSDDLLRRVEMFNAFRDNNGTFVIDKTGEEFTNVAAPLSGVAELIAQAQEQMASVAAIPLVELLGITPSGLNASSDGEVRTFYANVKSYQERALGPVLADVIEIVQLAEFGDVDRDITFDFVDLWELGEVDKAAVQKARADTDAAYVTMGAVSNEEVRERLSSDETSIYHGVDLSGEAPDLDEGEDDDKQARDAAFVEGDHPRDDAGRFTDGAGGPAAAADIAKFAASPTVWKSKASGIEYVANPIAQVETSEKRQVHAQQEALEDAFADGNTSFFSTTTLDPNDLKSLQNQVARNQVASVASKGSFNAESNGEAPLVIKGPNGLIVIDGNHRATAAMIAGGKLKAQVFDYEGWKMAQDAKKTTSGPKKTSKEDADALLADLLG